MHQTPSPIRTPSRASAASVLRRGVVGLVSAAVLAATAGAGLASAEEGLAEPATSVSHPDADYLGSTIRAHHDEVEASAGGSPEQSSRTTVSAAITGTLGLDVSNWQPNVSWAQQVANGAKFAYVKATEATTYVSPSFAKQYSGSYDAGLVRGAYHFAVPNASSGTAQANYFVNNGGGWSADGRTLPPMLDIEYNPYAGNTCYNLTPSQMVTWIRDFSNTVFNRTGRHPTIYTTTNWWNQCTGSNASFGDTNPLFLARYGSTPGTMPAGWDYQTIWQYSDSGIFAGDQNVFNGSVEQLRRFAAGDGAAVTPPVVTPPVADNPVPNPGPEDTVSDPLAGINLDAIIAWIITWLKSLFGLV